MKVQVKFNADEKAAMKMLGLVEPDISYNTIDASKTEKRLNDAVAEVVDTYLSAIADKSASIDNMNGEGFTKLALSGVAKKYSLFASRTCSSVAKQLYAIANPKYAEVFAKSKAEVTMDDDSDAIELDI